MQMLRNIVNGPKINNYVLVGNLDYRLRPETTSTLFADPPSTTHV